MKKIKYTFIVLLFLNSLTAFAESWYQVEIIIFDRLYPDLSEEGWSDEEPAIRPDMTELYPYHVVGTDQGLIPYMIMDKKNNRMNGIYRVLKLSSEYRPLVHISWQQPATKRHKSRYIHIVKNDSKKDLPVKDNQESIDEPEFIEDFINNKRIIDGSIRVRSNFYLHVDLDIYYFKDLLSGDVVYEKKDGISNQNIEKLIIGLKESRRIKLNERHYFDNPVYGVILQVSRLNES